MDEKTINLLIVDDDANARRTLGEILKRKGYSVDSAGTGAEAIAKARSGFFNIAFIDIRLPDMNGMEVLKGIRDASEDTVAIMVTAYASIDSSIDAINKGAYSYITKPIDMGQILLAIDKGLEKQRLSMENKRLLRDLQEANEKLREMDKRKSYFVANVSHEFKNPLAIVREALSLTIDKVAGDINPKQEDLLHRAKSNVERLIRLVTDILDLSKIEAGKMEMRREKVDIGSLINDVCAMYENEISKKQLALKKAIPQDAGFIWADKDKVTQAVINLLTNAIKYTPSGTIAVQLTATQESVRFEVADTGPGIPKESAEKIFDKFERITAEKQEGTGLGLPIAKDIIELHKGRIWVESPAWKDQPAGKQGSRFIFTLPRELRREG